MEHGTWNMEHGTRHARETRATAAPPLALGYTPSLTFSCGRNVQRLLTLILSSFSTRSFT